MNFADLIDGDKFERLARDLGLLYVELHDFQAGSLKDRGWVNVLSHNSDCCIVHRGVPWRSCVLEWENVAENVGHWFGQNVDVEDERLTPIPIGLERDRWHPQLRKKETILTQPRPESKTKLLYLNVNTEIVTQREELYRRFGDVDWCTTERGKNGVRFGHYVRQLSEHKFVLAPDGNGMDTHRTWETLYLGSFPVVERHRFTEAFAEQLPLLIVDDWGQITQEFLGARYDEFTGREWNWDALTMGYWANLIRSKL